MLPVRGWGVEKKKQHDSLRVFAFSRHCCANVAKRDDLKTLIGGLAFKMTLIH